MKISKYISLIVFTLFFLSCEEVVNVNLDTTKPRLVIDAAINWQNKQTEKSPQKIILSTTTDFYGNLVPKVSDAIVSINSKSYSWIFKEGQNPGEYLCDDFTPIIDETYTLTINYKGETYTATETMQSVTAIDEIKPKNDGGFSGKDYGIEVYFKDPIAENFYMVKFMPEIYKSPRFRVIGDKLTNGNQKSWRFSDEDLKQGTRIDITHYGISEAYYNYMNKIISIASSSAGGSPFQTPPATVRGNIVNSTDAANYALGYFSLSEVDVEEYVIQ
jgi:hypothetical protein